MSRVKMGTLVIALVLGFATGGWSQGMGGGMGRQMPRMLGAFKPVVGTGAQYEMTVKDRTMHYAYAIVGQEDVEGSTGYWMEIRTQGAGMPGETVMKELVVPVGDKPQIKRMIMQSSGRPPMEMPMGMMPGMGQRERAPQQGDSGPGEMVGSETITVPAGTFECDDSRPLRAWLNITQEPLLPMADFIREWNRREQIPLSFGTPVDFFHALEKERAALPLPSFS